MRKIVPAALAAALLTITTAAPAVAADSAVVFLGGTGTSASMPFPTTTIDAFVAPLVSGPHGTSQVLYHADPWDRPQAAAPALHQAVVTTPEGTQVTIVGLSKGAQVAHAVLIRWN